MVKTLQNIMRKDPGVSGDAQRIEEIGWLLFIKVLDDKQRSQSPARYIVRNRDTIRESHDQALLNRYLIRA